MRLLTIIFILEFIFRITAQDVILESEEGHKTTDDNGVSDSSSSVDITKTPNFILLCALIPQIPGCPCDPLLETRPTFYDFVSSDCSCYDSQQSGFSSPPCFCSKPDSHECKCLSGLSSLDEEHDRMCIVSPLTYVTPYANCTSFLNPLGEDGLCNGDSEASEHCVTLKSCRRLTPISIEESSVQEKCVTDPESEGCPCSSDQLITDEDALICSCYKNTKNPGCPCDVEPNSPICNKFTELIKSSTSTSTSTQSTTTKQSNETHSTTKNADTKEKEKTSSSTKTTENKKTIDEEDIVSHNNTLMKDSEPQTDKDSSSHSTKLSINFYLSIIYVVIISYFFN